MKIEEKINESIKDSMKEKNRLRLDSLRAIKSAILIEKTKSGSKDQIEESVVLKILQKMVKQRNDSAKIYLEQNRKELAEIEVSQANIISEFLPTQLSESELSEIIDKVIGISKFSRVADWVFSRPHIQEEAVMILADEIERLCEPKGLAILVKAKHYCMCWRGVKEPNTSMINSIVRGDFRHDISLKQEFFELVKQQPNGLSCY